MPITYGSKYDRNLSTVQVAKLIRQEIKADVKAGNLPAGKYSVRIDESSTSASIDVRISELAGEVFDRDFLVLGHEKHHANQRKAGIPISRYSAPVRAALARVEAMLGAYNFSDTGSLSNVNFFASVEVLADADAARAQLLAGAPAVAPAGKLKLSRKERDYLLTWTLQEDDFEGIEELEAKLEGREPVELNAEELEILVRWTSVPDGEEDFPGVDTADLLRRLTAYRDALPVGAQLVAVAPAGVAPVPPALPAALMEEINASKLEPAPIPSNVVFLSPPCHHGPPADQVAFMRYLGAL